MRLRLIRFIQWLMAMTPYEIRSRWKIVPDQTLYALSLVLAYYRIRGETVTIVQVGACDGVETDDPIRDFIYLGKTRSILIEPNPVAFALLQKTYAGVPGVTLVQAAISDKDGEAFLYRVKDGDTRGTKKNPLLGISSFDRNHLTKRHIPDDQIERLTVPCRTLAGLVAEFGLTKIDLLQIDVEGYDAEVVRMALAMPVRPECIECEHNNLPPAVRGPMFARLEAENYLVATNTWNLVALQKDVLEAWKTGKKLA
jgi:FkbM family methyltransferase